MGICDETVITRSCVKIHRFIIFLTIRIRIDLNSMKIVGSVTNEIIISSMYSRVMQ